MERFDDDRVCVVQGPTSAHISGIRVEADEVPALVGEVRTRVAPEKSTDWLLGPSSTPADLDERLRSLGFGDPEDGATVLRAVACVTPPPPGPVDVTAHRVETFADYAAAMELMWDAFEMPEAGRAARRPHLGTVFDAGGPTTFVAELEGRPAGVGRAVHSERGGFLIGGAVLPRARGRGVYRALVRARWDDAVTRGAPALVTQALPHTSYPILKRLGFADVCTVRRLEDRAR